MFLESTALALVTTMKVEEKEEVSKYKQLRDFR